MAFWPAKSGSGGARKLPLVLLQQLQRGGTARVAVMGARRPIVMWPKQPLHPSGAVLRTRLLQGRSSWSSHPSQRWHRQQQGGSRKELSSSGSGGGSGAGRAQSTLRFYPIWSLTASKHLHANATFITSHHTTYPGAREAQAAELAERNKRLGLYFFSIVVAVTGVCYASVPLYKVFCQVRVLLLNVFARGGGLISKRSEYLIDLSYVNTV